MASSAESFLQRARDRLAAAEKALEQSISAEASAGTIRGLREEVQNRKRIVMEWEAEVKAEKK